MNIYNLLRPMIQMAKILFIAVLFLGQSVFAFKPFETAQAGVTILRYVAPTGTDTGYCTSASAPCRTIQYAVNIASSNNKILVAEGVYTYNPSTDLCNFFVTRAVVCFVDKRLTIIGGYSPSNWSDNEPEQNLTVIDGGNNYRGVTAVGYNTTTAYLEMEGFTIQNSKVVGPTFSNNPYPGAMGGGMLIQKASVSLNDIIFKNNRAYGANMGSGDGGAADGGAIRIESAPSGTTSYIRNVTFDGNQSIGGSGPVRGGVAFGSLFIYETNVVIEDSTFVNNLARGGSSGGSGTSTVDGLQADALGGAVALENGSLIVRRSSFSQNAVNGGSATSKAGGAYGGAVFTEGVNGFVSTLEMSDSTITNNSATAGNAGKGGNAAGGGFNAVDTAINIQRTKFNSNSVIGGGSSAGEAGPGAGGGIYIFAVRSGIPRAIMQNIEVIDNFADQGTIGTTGLGNGGGGGMVIHGMNADIIHATIAQNRLGINLVLGGGILVQPWALQSGLLPANVNLNYSIISDHIEGNSIASAVVVQKNSSMNLQKNLFASNSEDINFYNIPVSPGTITGFETSILADDAKFVSPGTPIYNYHVRFDSLANNMAEGSTTSVDLDGQTRNCSTGCDLGSHEYNPFPLTTSPRNGSIALDWCGLSSEHTGGVNNYEVVLGCAVGDTSPECGQVLDAGRATSFVISGLQNDKQYMIKVNALDLSQNLIAASVNVTASPSSHILFLPAMNR